MGGSFSELSENEQSGVVASLGASPPRRAWTAIA
jgi:hypothetical protein